MSGEERWPGKGLLRLADTLTALLLALELWGILSGLPYFLPDLLSGSLRKSSWAAMAPAPLMLVLMAGFPLVAALAAGNIAALARKRTLPKGWLYPRTNAMALQVVFFPLTALAYCCTFCHISIF